MPPATSRPARCFHVILEGIFRADHYADMLIALVADYQGRAFCYYLDVPFDESLRRHAGKLQAAQYGAAEMKAWYRELDLLPGGAEQVIPAAMTQDEVVRGSWPIAVSPPNRREDP